MRHSRMKSLALRSLVLSFVLFLSVVACHAQSAESAALGGVVQDKSGAVIPNVDVKITNVDSGVTRQVKTDRSGAFQVPGLPAGNYDVHLEHSGFSDVEVTGIKLEVAGNRQLSIKLPVGKEQQTVTVSADAMNMNTTDASVSTVIDQRLISDLPLNGRSLDSLFQLTPGAVAVGSTLSTDGGGNYSINGQRPSANNLTIDGASGNIYVGTSGATPGLAGSTYAISATGGTNGLLPIDAVEEYRIQTSTYSAEYGRSPGGQIQVRTKSGTNAFHGSLFEYFRNQVMDATDWFVKYDGLKQAPLRMNDFGGSLGAPLWKDKLFFFAAHETLDLDQPNNTSADVPSAYAKQVTSSIFQPFLAAYPNGNGGPDSTAEYPQYTDIYNEEYATQIFDHSTSARFDVALPHNTKLFYRVNVAPSSQTVTAWSGSHVNLSLNTHTVGYTSAFTPNLVDEATLNYSSNSGGQTYITRQVDGAAPAAFSSYCAQSATGPGGIECLVGGLNDWAHLYSGFLASSTTDQFDLVDTLRWQKQKHSMAFGADYRRLTTQKLALTGDAIYIGNINGPTSLSGSTLDLVSTTSTNNDIKLPTVNLSLFAQDTWRPTNHLSISYGLRWELNPPISDGHGGPLAVEGDIDQLSTLTPAPRGTAIYKTSYANFAPRFGLAYVFDQNGNSATVLRLGAGLFYDTGQAASTAPLFENSYPYSLSAIQLTVPFSELDFHALQQNAATQTLPQSLLYVAAPTLRLPYTGQWNVALEQMLTKAATVSLTYLGADGEQLARTTDSYGLAPALVSAPYGVLYLLSNSGLSNYQALQAQGVIRSHSVDAVVSYTYSHDIDNGSSDFTGPMQNVTDYRGNADYDLRHVFSAGISLKSRPLGSEYVLRSVTKGWELATFTRLQSAFPLTVRVLSYPGPLINSIANFADLVPGVDPYLRGGIGSNGKTIPGGIQLNPAAFTTPPENAQGQYLRDGDSGRNRYRLFGLHQFDLSAGRDFPITERMTLKFKVEAFNLFNTPAFSDVEATVGYANFGQAMNTYAGASAGGSLNPVFQSGGPRNIQLTARIVF